MEAVACAEAVSKDHHGAMRPEIPYAFFRGYADSGASLDFLEDAARAVTAAELVDRAIRRGPKAYHGHGPEATAAHREDIERTKMAAQALLDGRELVTSAAAVLVSAIQAVCAEARRLSGPPSGPAIGQLGRDRQSDGGGRLPSQ